MTAPRPSGAVAGDCSSLVDDAPDSVAGAKVREVSPSDGYAGAWGDPAIVLRCGVPRPAALTRTSQCFVVNGVGWLVTQDGAEVDPTAVAGGTLVFTTIGRSAYVEVTVPDRYSPAADALVDLTPTIKAHVPERQSCR